EVVLDAEWEAGQRLCKIAYAPEDSAPVFGDRELLRRAADNILRNAIHYAPPQSRVNVELQRKGDYAVVRVRDQGPGVPEQELGKIFDPFLRVEEDRNRTSGGVGLGLAITQRAIVLHQGRVSARNAGPGLEVTIELPLAAMN